jgi:hypothetical protein
MSQPRTIRRAFQRSWFWQTRRVPITRRAFLTRNESCGPFRFTVCRCAMPARTSLIERWAASRRQPSADRLTAAGSACRRFVPRASIASAPVSDDRNASRSWLTSRRHRLCWEARPMADVRVRSPRRRSCEDVHVGESEARDVADQVEGERRDRRVQLALSGDEKGRCRHAGARSDWPAGQSALAGSTTAGTSQMTERGGSLISAESA